MQFVKNRGEKWVTESGNQSESEAGVVQGKAVIWRVKPTRRIKGERAVLIMKRRNWCTALQLGYHRCSSRSPQHRWPSQNWFFICSVKSKGHLLHFLKSHLWKLLEQREPLVFWRDTDAQYSKGEHRSLWNFSWFGAAFPFRNAN